MRSICITPPAATDLYIVVARELQEDGGMMTHCIWSSRIEMPLESRMPTMGDDEAQLRFENNRKYMKTILRL